MNKSVPTDETLRQSELTAQGEIAIKAVDGLHIDIKQINQKTVSQTIDAMVQADPNLAWLKDAEARGDVDWQRVQEIHDSFKYSSSGLGVCAQLAIAIAIAAMTAGAASAAAGSMAGATAGSGTVMAAGAAGGAAADIGNAAATAALTSMAANAGVSAVNNKGNLGATTTDIFSSDSLKGYATAALIAAAGAYTNNWGKTQGPEGNYIVVDKVERAKAYAANTALKGALSGQDDGKTWLTIAGTGALMELYQYSAGREPDIRPGVDRPGGAKFTPLDGGLVPQVTVDGVFREGKNIGLNRIAGCESFYSVCHGTPISNALNVIPGFNAFATLHDRWMIGLEAAKGTDMSWYENIGSMPPALLVNYGAIYDKYRSQVEVARKNEN